MAYATSITNLPVPPRRKSRATERRIGAPPTAGRGPFPPRARAAGHRRRGFTLIEAMIASVVLAIAVVAISSSLVATVKQSAVVEQESTAQLLARQLMEEISAKPYLDPDTGTAVSKESNRPNYDNVADYDGYADTVDADHPLTGLKCSSGGVVTNNRKYTRAVKVEFRTSPNGAAAASGDFALITVTVTGPTGRQTQLSRMAANTTLMQQQP